MEIKRYDGRKCIGGLRLAAVDVGHDLRGIIPVSIPLGPQPSSRIPSPD